MRPITASRNIPAGLMRITTANEIEHNIQMLILFLFSARISKPALSRSMLTNMPSVRRETSRTKKYEDEINAERDIANTRLKAL